MHKLLKNLKESGIDFSEIIENISNSESEENEEEEELNYKNNIIKIFKYQLLQNYIFKKCKENH